MSKPDPTGESLESILASIRRSLSEQSTDVLAEEPAAPAEAPKGAISGLARRLAESGDDLPLPVEDLGPVEPEPDILALPGEPQPDAPPLSAPVPSQAVLIPTPTPAPAQPQKDALWFLGARGGSETGSPARPEAPAPAAVAPQPVTSKPAQSGVVRGPLPPFFGSSAEAQKAEVVLVQPSSPGAGMILPPAPQPTKPANGQAGPALGQAADGGLRNGAAGVLFGQAAQDARAAAEGATPHVQGLEAMVAELLRPMLQRWLDENMPRLVSAALKDEAIRMAARNSDKR
jgi:cell pole-organizing protein PopZ